MSNKQRGLVTFEFEGKERRFRLSFNAICILEDELKKPMDQIFKELDESMSALTLRSIVRAGLMAAEGTPTSPMDAGRMIDELGIDEIAEVITESVKASFPTVEIPEDAPGEEEGDSGK